MTALQACSRPHTSWLQQGLACSGWLLMRLLAACAAWRACQAESRHVAACQASASCPAGSRLHAQHDRWAPPSPPLSRQDKGTADSRVRATSSQLAPGVLFPGDRSVRLTANQPAPGVLQVRPRARRQQQQQQQQQQQEQQASLSPPGGGHGKCSVELLLSPGCRRCLHMLHLPEASSCALTAQGRLMLWLVALGSSDWVPLPLRHLHVSLT